MPSRDALPTDSASGPSGLEAFVPMCNFSYEERRIVTKNCLVANVNSCMSLNMSICNPLQVTICENLNVQI